VSALTALVEGRPLTSQERLEALSWRTRLTQAEATIAAVRAELYRDVLASADRVKRAREDRRRLARHRRERMWIAGVADLLPALEEPT